MCTSVLCSVSVTRPPSMAHFQSACTSRSRSMRSCACLAASCKRPSVRGRSLKSRRQAPATVVGSQRDSEGQGAAFSNLPWPPLPLILPPLLVLGVALGCSFSAHLLLPFPLLLPPFALLGVTMDSSSSNFSHRKALPSALQTKFSVMYWRVRRSVAVTPRPSSADLQSACASERPRGPALAKASARRRSSASYETPPILTKYASCQDMPAEEGWWESAGCLKDD
mmetsp:Transcript_108337/g.316952  ORF Transcript_108337/g.316952 Transcript_108337/m.316952 type:complete len:225 (-) Transcript_108337:10-684(-)